MFFLLRIILRKLDTRKRRKVFFLPELFSFEVNAQLPRISGSLRTIFLPGPFFRKMKKDLKSSLSGNFPPRIFLKPEIGRNC